MHPLPNSSSERLNLLFRAAESVWDGRGDIQEAYPDITVWDFWYWLMWYGTRDHDELRRHVFPQPPRHLIERVVGSQSDRECFLSGLVDWRRMYRSLNLGGFDPARGGKLLDFGCGCGRILQFFARYADSTDLYGADVDAEAIEWCSASLDFATFDTVGHSPPTQYESKTFDAVYAFSVFSHLPEERHLAWLRELHRITRPGGIVVLTVAGKRVLEEILSGRRDEGRPSATEVRAKLYNIEQVGFHFFPYEAIDTQDPRTHHHFDSWDLQEYGLTFILEPYIRSRWSQLFHIITVDVAPDDWQDYVVMRRLALRS